MLHSLLTPNVVSYSATVSACEKSQHWKERSGSNFLTPNVVSYKATVSACEKNQQWKEASRMLRKEGLHLLR